MAESEAEIKRKILLARSDGKTMILFNNPCGVGYQGQIQTLPDGSVVVRGPRRITFGLTPGGSDLIGIQAVLITPDMAGQVFGRFVAVEVKNLRWRERDDQKNFREVITKLGGLGIVARSVDDVRAALQQNQVGDKQ